MTFYSSLDKKGGRHGLKVKAKWYVLAYVAIKICTNFSTRIKLLEPLEIDNTKPFIDDSHESKIFGMDMVEGSIENQVNTYTFPEIDPLKKNSSV